MCTHFVLKQLDPSTLKRVQQCRVAKNLARFDIPPDYATKGFFIDVDGELRKCIVYDLVPTDKTRPIKIRQVDGANQWSYPHALFLSRARSIPEQTRKRKMSLEEAQKRLDDSGSDDDDDDDDK